MIKVEKLNETNFVIKSDGKTLKVDNIKSLFAWCMTFGAYFEEIEVALHEMIKMNHNICEFGVDGYFIFSERKVNEKYH
jgi:hypothetical protein